MLKYKMTVPHVQTEIFNFFSFQSICKYTGEKCELPQLMSVHVLIFNRKIKMQNKFLIFKVKWCVVAAWLLVFCPPGLSDTV